MPIARANGAMFPQDQLPPHAEVLKTSIRPSHLTGTYTALIDFESPATVGEGPDVLFKQGFKSERAAQAWIRKVAGVAKRKRSSKKAIANPTFVRQNGGRPGRQGLPRGKMGKAELMRLLNKELKALGTPEAMEELRRRQESRAMRKGVVSYPKRAGKK